MSKTFYKALTVVLAVLTIAQQLLVFEYEGLNDKLQSAVIECARVLKKEKPCASTESN